VSKNGGRHLWTVSGLRLSPAVLVLFAVLAVLVCTLFPFNFTNDPFRAAKSSLSLEIGPELGPEVVENAVLFVPLGFALALYFNYKGCKSWVALMSVLAASLALSYAVELLQLFVPSRVSSLTDVFGNVAGGCLGFLISGRRRDTALVAAVAYLITISLMSIPLQWSTTLRDWEREFPLIVGNEHTGDRPWRGRVFDVSVLDRALSDGEVADLLVGGKAAEWIVNSAVASYEPSAPGGYRDKSGHLPPLAWRTTTEGAEAGAHRWLETTGPATVLVDRVKKESAFTLLVTAATADTYQSGPARIVSLSRDPGRRNFTLGQSEHNMVFRLRTPLTGENGSRPEFVVPDVFSTNATRHLVVTYDGLDLVAYVDGVRSSHAMRLGLGAAAFAPLFNQRPDASYAYSVLYHAFVFVPAGMLIARLGHAVRRPQPSLQVPTLAAGVLVCSFLFESILVAASGRGFNWSSVFWTMTFATTGVAARELERIRHAAPFHMSDSRAAS